MDANAAPASFTADLLSCSALTQLTSAEVSELFMGALANAGATIVETVSHAFPETGLTCVLILRESHAVLHTWPETGMVNIDISTCTTGLRSLAAIAQLGESLGAAAVSVQEIARADGHSPRSDPRR
jgi:S-adenosylmethionine decarboxylase